MKRWIPRLVVLAVLVALALGPLRIWLEPDPIPVRVVQVERGRVQATVTNSKAGTVTARRRALISPELGGRVARLGARRGERVAEGDVLLELDHATQEAAVLLAERGLDSAQALARKACIVAERAGRELERNRDLAARAVVSADVLDALESAKELAIAGCAAAEAEVGQARARVVAARTELDKMTLRAPFAGVVAEVSVELGEWATPSPPVLAVPGVIDLVDPTSLYVAAPMDEVDSGRLAVGQRARVTIDSRPGESHAGHVARIAPYVLDVAQQNRTVEIEVELDDEQLSQSLLPGTSADVEVVLEEREDVLRLPTATLLEGGRVLVVEDGLLRERRVETGLRNWDWVELRGGLAEGDEVVATLDRVEIVPGARVTLENGPGDEAGTRP